MPSTSTAVYAASTLTEPQEFASPRDTIAGYPSALTTFVTESGDGWIPRCVWELDIMKMEGSIREKDEWWNKVRDPSIASKWHQEFMDHLAAQQQQKLEQGQEIAEVDKEYFSKLVNYAISECQYLADKYKEGPVRPATVDGVFLRDDLKALDNGELHRKLLQQIATLRSQPAIGATREDRHPGTPQMVDLVHPSLYAYERGKSIILPNVGAEATQMPEWSSFLSTQGTTEEIPTNDDSSKSRKRKRHKYSGPFPESGLQWLPAEFHVSQNGQECSINSYINNLHPIEHKAMYKSIGKLFCHVVPLLEEVLAEAGEHVEKTYSMYDRRGTALRERQLRVPVPNDEWWVGEPNDGQDEDDFYDNPDVYRTFVLPEIPEFSSPPQFTRERANVSLCDRPLQVIVKIASLEIDPRDSYQGGVWHVEGTLGERIVATACCYLECSNVVGGELAFRTNICEPDYEQNDEIGVKRMYNLDDEALLIQDGGFCTTNKEGRVLAWPNTKQHRLLPVQLADRLQPGKRTICCFFLVDPTVRVRSTATVPPQQLAWWTESAHTSIPSVAGINDQDVVQNNTSPLLQRANLLTYEAACERRQRLMNERSTPIQGDEDFMVRTFSLCEH
ncbi:hypothetical protein ACA910_021247 [Epithemia clementina (nom. ined.)]